DGYTNVLVAGDGGDFVELADNDSHVQRRATQVYDQGFGKGATASTHQVRQHRRQTFRHHLHVDNLKHLALVEADFAHEVFALGFNIGFVFLAVVGPVVLGDRQCGDNFHGPGLQASLQQRVMDAEQV